MYMQHGNNSITFRQINDVFSNIVYFSQNMRYTQHSSYLSSSNFFQNMSE